MRNGKKKPSKNKNQEEFSPDELVDIINEKEKISYEGKIIAIKGDLIIVQNMHNNKEEIYSIKENKVLKQWGRSQPIQKYNRVDLELRNTNFWVEAIVLDIKKSTNQVLLKYRNSNRYKQTCEEWINLETKRVAPIGLYTKYDKNIDTPLEEANKNIFLGKKTSNPNSNNISLNKDQEEKFQNVMKKNNFEIKTIRGDGNCLFRAVSDQVYGTDKHYDIIRQKCMDYLEVQKRFFKLFVDGDFDEYIKQKRMDAIWGDDIEIEALSEIYNRPIEIYSGSITPLRCFHEDKNNYTYNKTPIRLSYHGRKHYNSVIPLEEAKYQYKLFEDSLIKTPPGKYEDKIIHIAKDNEERFDQGIKISEEEYIDKLKKNLDKINEDFLDKIIYALNNNNSNINIVNYDLDSSKENENKKIKKKKEREEEKKEREEEKKEREEEKKEKEAEKEEKEKERKEKEKEIKEKEKEEKVKEKEEKVKEKEENKKSNNIKNDINQDIFANPVIKEALELGFEYNDIIEAWTYYGDDKELLINYLINSKNQD